MDTIDVDATNCGLINAGMMISETLTDAWNTIEQNRLCYYRKNKNTISYEDYKGLTDELARGGTPPRFLIIDDGWQQIGVEANKEPEECLVQEGVYLQYMMQVCLRMACPCRLLGRCNRVKPAATGMEHYDSALTYPVQSPGVKGNQLDIVMDSVSVHGLGLVQPKKVFDFYNELHAYLSSCGVDGVNVDVQNIIGEGHGERVALTRSYHQALEASISRNFPDNGCIACMCHSTDGMYSAKKTVVVRASDDLFTYDPHNSLHPTADYHAAARAVGGCPIYVSDKPGNHNFELLKKLVLPDGSVLRAKLPGRPTRDYLFANPARDGTSLLKVWNTNKCSGVVGVFNCQCAGWCKVAKKTLLHDTLPCTLTGSVRATDVDLMDQVVGAD
ncbi:hypothetical protein IFM89_023170 [Coptis chinensis]|uniref:Uncharacterized protein n=1 Tax=Coptis chinensis TaxID=261450 RepID=A0A835HXS6_9MAGN|nr:hypothetical protein IFM89_023170 [Coptis chinensis]